MTNTTPPSDGNTRERLTAMEDGLRHFREICEMRDRAIHEAFDRVRTQNEKQDIKMEVLEEHLMAKIEGIYKRLWSIMTWGGGLIAATLLSIVLKALNLV